MKNLFLLLLITLFVVRCGVSTMIEKKPAVFGITIIGEYASPEYFENHKKYDWIALLISKVNDSTLKVRIRSRIDIKKPTCTDNFLVTKTNDSTYQYKKDNSTIILTFNPTQVSITSAGDDPYILQRCCSGGGTIGGKYLKSDTPIDRLRLDTTNLQ